MESQSDPDDVTVTTERHLYSDGKNLANYMLYRSGDLCGSLGCSLGKKKLKIISIPIPHHPRHTFPIHPRHHVMTSRKSQPMEREESPHRVTGEAQQVDPSLPDSEESSLYDDDEKQLVVLPTTR